MQNISEYNDWQSVFSLFTASNPPSPTEECEAASTSNGGPSEPCPKSLTTCNSASSKGKFGT